MADEMQFIGEVEFPPLDGHHYCPMCGQWDVAPVVGVYPCEDCVRADDGAETRTNEKSALALGLDDSEALQELREEMQDQQLYQLFGPRTGRLANEEEWLQKSAN